MAGSKNLWIEVPPSADHANTAVLLTGDRFPDVFWDNVLATGEDIIIYDNANNKLTRQLVAINTGAKTMELYVKSPSSATAKTYLRMNYDDAAGAEVNDFADYEDYHETYSARVAASADDARAYYTGAGWAYSLVVGDLTVGYYAANNYAIGGGMRWLALNIPQSSNIITAIVQYTSAAARANNDVNSRWTGLKTGTPTAFGAITDYQTKRGVVVGGASNDYITTTQVAHDAIAAWVLDGTYDSPELKTIVQEINDTYDIIDLALFHDDHDGRSTVAATVTRSAYSFNGSAAKAPLLTVNYIPKLDYAVYTNDPITRTNVPRIARIMLSMHG